MGRSSNHCFGEAASQGEVGIAEDVGWVGRHEQVVAVCYSIQEGFCGPTKLLGNSKRMHHYLYNPTSAWPSLTLQICVHRPGEQESAGSPFAVHCPLDCSEHSGNLLPFVKQYRLRQAL